MIWNWNERSDDTYPESIIKIQDMKLVNTKYFKFLGIWISSNKFSIEEKEVKHRIGHTRNSF